MIDINQIRADVEAYKQICANKNKNIDVDALILLDNKRKELQQKVDTMKHEQKNLAENKNYEEAKKLKIEIQKIEEEHTKKVRELNVVLLQSDNLALPKHLTSQSKIMKTLVKHSASSTKKKLPKLQALDLLISKAISYICKMQ